MFTLTDQESTSVFDGLVSAETVALDSNLLTRLPSLKNMANLRALWITANHITQIFTGVHLPPTAVQICDMYSKQSYLGVCRIVRMLPPPVQATTRR